MPNNVSLRQDGHDYKLHQRVRVRSKLNILLFWAVSRHRVCYTFRRAGFDLHLNDVEYMWMDFSAVLFVLQYEFHFFLLQLRRPHWILVRMSRYSGMQYEIREDVCFWFSEWIFRFTLYLMGFDSLTCFQQRLLFLINWLGCWVFDLRIWVFICRIDFGFWVWISRLVL